MRRESLKPCPFCGDTHIIVRKPQIERPTGGYVVYETKYVIGCNTLGCICLHTKTNHYDSEEDAIRAWNRRVKSDTHLTEHCPEDELRPYGESDWG